MSKYTHQWMCGVLGDHIELPNVILLFKVSEFIPVRFNTLMNIHVSFIVTSTSCTVSTYITQECSVTDCGDISHPPLLSFTGVLSVNKNDHRRNET